MSLTPPPLRSGSVPASTLPPAGHAVHRPAPPTRLTQALQVDPGFDPHSVKHVNEILGRQISGRARRIRTPTHSAHAGVEITNAHLQANQNVGERAPSRVVHVHRDPFARNLRAH